MYAPWQTEKEPSEREGKCSQRDKRKGEGYV